MTVNNTIGAAELLRKYLESPAGSNLLGGSVVGDLRAVPRAVYTDPPVAAVGLTVERAGLIGMDVQIASIELGATVGSATDASPVGRLFLVADRVNAVLVGAAGIGGHGDEWLGELALPIRAEIPLQDPGGCNARPPDVQRGLRIAAARVRSRRNMTKPNRCRSLDRSND